MPTNVVIFSAGQDTGGQGYRLKCAFDRYQTDFSVRSVHSDTSYFHYPEDLAYDASHAYEWFDKADIIHLRNRFSPLERLRTNPAPYGLLIQHHGTKFRTSPREMAAAARELGAIQLASTLDLVVLDEDVSWLPSPYDLDELAAYRANALPYLDQERPIRIAHAPTERTIKSTAAVMNSIHTLVALGFPVVLDLIERKTHHETLCRKAKADILVDQLKLGYGNNAVEAWGMGIPVVAGIEDGAVRERMLREWGSLPFYEANETNLTERLIDLITDEEFRRAWGCIGLSHTIKYHDDMKVSDRLARYYRMALERATSHA